MRALKFSEASGLVLEGQHAKPIATADEALIRVIRAGICSTVSSSVICPVTTFNNIWEAGLTPSHVHAGS